MRIVFATRIARPPVIKALQQFGTAIDLVDCEDLSQVAAHVQDADVIVISDPRGPEGRAIAAALREPGCRVRWVQVLTAGVEGLLAHGIPQHIAVTNQGGAVAPTVAEHGMAMILAMGRRLGEITARSAKHEWSKEFTPPLVSMEGKVMAIVGYGNIGRQLARRAAAFDMTLLGVSRSLASDPLLSAMYPMDRMAEALALADVVALTVASAPGTRHLIDAKAFAAMKKGALFINLTRGETVDQAALKDALTSGQLASAFIDVTEPEPLPPGDPLWDAPNLVISPHTAGAGSTRTGVRIAQVVSENLRSFMDGKPLKHLIKG